MDKKLSGWLCPKNQ